MQMRAVQWLWLWVAGHGITDLARLASLVPAACMADPIALDAPPNAQHGRPKRTRRKPDSWDGQRGEIDQIAPGVLAGRLAAQLGAADAAAAAGAADTPGYFLRASQPQPTEPVLLRLTDRSAATVLATSHPHLHPDSQASALTLALTPTLTLALTPILALTPTLALAQILTLTPTLA